MQDTDKKLKCKFISRTHSGARLKFEPLNFLMTPATEKQMLTELHKPRKLSLPPYNRQKGRPENTQHGSKHLRDVPQPKQKQLCQMQINRGEVSLQQAPVSCQIQLLAVCPAGIT